MSNRRNPERDIHRAVVKHLRARAVPGLVWFHCPNGAYLGGVVIRGALQKALGVRPGVADFILLHDGKFYALELKAPGGRLSPDQLYFLQEVNAAGGYAAVAEGLDRALGCLEMWGVMRGQAA